MNGVQRFIASIRRHGWLKTAVLVPSKIVILASKAGDHWFDARHGTITRRVIKLETLDITSENIARGIRYEPTRARPLQKLLRRLQLPRRGTFVDFGCGMGRVLLIAADHGFKHVVGVDFSFELCDRARKNARDYAQKHPGRELNIAVVQCDAVDYAIQPWDQVFYFFNPFKAALMKIILNKILQSYDAHSREIWIIYHNPVWNNAFDTQRRVRLHSQHRFADCYFYVYRIPQK